MLITSLPNLSPFRKIYSQICPPLLPNLSPFSGGKIKEDFEIEGQKEEAPNEVKININKEWIEGEIVNNSSKKQT